MSADQFCRTSWIKKRIHWKISDILQLCRCEWKNALSSYILDWFKILSWIQFLLRIPNGLMITDKYWCWQRILKYNLWNDLRSQDDYKKTHFLWFYPSFHSSLTFVVILIASTGKSSHADFWKRISTYSYSQ